MSYASLAADLAVPQSEPCDARQVANSAGGHVYALDAFSRLERFLILGSDEPTFYQDARALTRENARGVAACWEADAARTAAAISAVSTARRAPKVSPAIFALALGSVHADAGVREASRSAVGAVCRTASHLFEYVALRAGLGGGWGRGAKRVVADWLAARDVDDLAHQMVKYRARFGWDHVRLLRVAHPVDAGDPVRTALHRWVLGLPHDRDALPARVRAHGDAMRASDDPREVARLVVEGGLTWEMVPTQALREPLVWEALLPGLPATALLRNLATLASLGLTGPLSAGEALVAERLGDPDRVRAERFHPYAILQALCVYRSGTSVRGSRDWTPSRRVVDALDAAFEPSFESVEPTGARHLLALDVSGSMGTSLIGGVVSAREAAAAMAMATMRREPSCHVVGFTAAGGGGAHGVSELALSPRDRLAETVAKTSRLPFGATDCAAPMLYALDRRIPVDVFVIYTDSETWAGAVHPVEALRRYRRAMGIEARLVVVGMTSTGFSIADPDDPGMLDVVGFDSAAIAAIAAFVSGRAGG